MSIFIYLFLPLTVLCDELYPPGVIFGYVENSHSCDRKCYKDRSMCCVFTLVVEFYGSLTGSCGNCSKGNVTDCYNTQCVPLDGFERWMLTYNRQYPGIKITVCQGDTIIVKVINRMPAEETSVHWHGIFQKGTQYSDGAPMITQCPIPSATTFIYKFFAQQCGSFFYHSHSGMQKADGLSGPLIIKSNEPEPRYHDCEDVTIFITDFSHTPAFTAIPGSSTPYTITTLFLNGKGSYFNSTGRVTNIPLFILRVKENKCYRLRYINGQSHVCGCRMTIEDHEVEVVEADSNPVYGTTVNSVDSESGERYDVLLNTKTNPPRKSYWIQARLINTCETSGVYQLGILTYSEEGNVPNPESPPPTSSNPLPRGKTMNRVNGGCNNRDNVCISDLKGLTKPCKEIYDEACETLFYRFDNRKIGNQIFQKNLFYPYFVPSNSLSPSTGTINGITFQLPSSPINYQRQCIDKKLICNQTNLPSYCNSTGPCQCMQLDSIPLNRCVQLVLIDMGSTTGNLSHPVHLHGNNFYVMSEGKFNSSIPTDQRQEWLKNNLPFLQLNQYPPIKDTLNLEPGGFAVVKLVAKNPGYWLLHCHFSIHSNMGMTTLIQVGHRDDLANPPKKFPKCQSFIPCTGNSTNEDGAFEHDDDMDMDFFDGNIDDMDFFHKNTNEPKYHKYFEPILRDRCFDFH